MIRYALACASGHRFESWFRDSGAFDEQRGHALVVCPTCGSTEVAKTIMAPAVLGAQRPEPATALREVSQDANPQAVGPSADESPVTVGLVDEKSRALRAMVRSFRETLFAEGHDVGSRFATEARRMHEGAIPERRIYGQASLAEARDLLEDGILVLPLPAASDDLN